MLFTKESIALQDLFAKKNNKLTSELEKLYHFFSNLHLKNISYQSYYQKAQNEISIQSSFISKNIKKQSSKLNNLISIVLFIEKTEVCLNVYYRKGNINTFINNIIDYIQFLLSIDDIQKEKIIINYYLTNNKKYIQSKIPTKDNINSGSCLNNRDTSIINIWRKEEVLKVTLHELIHALCFDDYNDTIEIINHYKQRYSISSGSVQTNEAYTEIWANLINCFLLSKKINPSDEKEFYKLVSFEKLFSDFQANKIFHHTGLDIKGKLININKNTNVLSYYIIRNELFNNLSQFLKFCRKNNTNYLKIQNPSKWLVFLKENNKVRKHKKKIEQIDHKKHEYKTLRMSINEMDLF